MPALSEILKEMDDNVKIQFLDEVLVRLKDRKQTSVTEVTFLTDEVSTHSYISENKRGMIIWFDTDEYNQAILELRGK
ncbi:hypothetical protein [Vibrio casei]|uniref:hypothetical protein n=1 Tax=Vibrio casei TaxID=673372 RepID=UPI003F98D3C1